MKTILMVIFTISYSIAYPQTQNQQIIGSAGKSSDSNAIQIAWTIGEVIVGKGVNNEILLTQGFHQSNLFVTALEEVSSIQMSIQPNPTSDFVSIKIDEKELKGATYTLFDIHGRIINQQKIETTELNISLQALPPASYFLRVNINEKVKTFKIIKN